VTSSKGFRTGQICAKDLLPGATLRSVLQIIGEQNLLYTVSTDVTIVEKYMGLIHGFVISPKHSYNFIVPLI